MGALVELGKLVTKRLHSKTQPKIESRYEIENDDLYLLIKNSSQVTIWDLRLRFESLDESNVPDMLPTRIQKTLAPGESLKMKLASGYVDLPIDVRAFAIYRLKHNSNKIVEDPPTALSAYHLRDYTLVDGMIRLNVFLARDPREINIPLVQLRLDELDKRNPHIADEKRWWNVDSSKRRYNISDKAAKRIGSARYKDRTP